MAYQNIIKFDTNVGEVSVRNVMIDTDGTNLEEGIELVSMDDAFPTFTLVGFDVNDLSTDDVDEFIENNSEEDVPYDVEVDDDLQDEINDISVRVTNKLVEMGFVPDDTDTDDENEFSVQDMIREVLGNSKLKI